MKRRHFLIVCCALLAPLLSGTAQSAPAKQAKPAHISKGAEVKLADHVVPGKTTIFDFYSDYCGPCVQFSPVLEKLHQSRDDVVVVKVDINRPGQRGIDWRSPVAQQYGLRSIPHFKVYGPDGKLVAEDAPNAYRGREVVLSLLKPESR